MVAPSQPLGASEACRPLARLRPEAPPRSCVQTGPSAPSSRLTCLSHPQTPICLRGDLDIPSLPQVCPRRSSASAPASGHQNWCPRPSADSRLGVRVGGVTSPAILAPVPQCPSATRAEPTLLPRCPSELMFGVWHSPWTWHPEASRSGWTRAEGLVSSVSPTSRAWAGSPQG